MNGWYGRGGRWGLAIFGIAMVSLAVWAYSHFGATLPTAIAVVIALGCFAAVFYAWRLARRALRPFGRAGGSSDKSTRRTP